MSDDREAQEWLNDGRFTDRGRTVNYTRAGQTVAVEVFTGRVTVVTRDRGGVATVARSRDYFLRPAALDFGAGPVRPAANDRITDPDPVEGGTFDVVPLEGEPSWRWTDEFKILIRLHCLEGG